MRASQLLQACCWAVGIGVVDPGGQGVGKGMEFSTVSVACFYVFKLVNMRHISWHNGLISPFVWPESHGDC
jgi:hypothetical protein